MAETYLIGLALIIGLGIGAQWLAWRLGLPAILLLLIGGFIAGPFMGWIKPVDLFGNLLLPIVSVSVAIILFEGGLSLKFSELKEVGVIVRNLVSIGVVVSWVFTTIASYFVLGLDLRLSTLLGAVLVVTGPTVVIPLLRHVRPSGRVGSVIKWEGIVIDPIGAILALLVFEAILAGGLGEATRHTIFIVIKSIAIGGATGFLGAQLLILVLRYHWVPDFLQNPVSLMVVVAVFTISNYFQTECGLLAVTLMGIILANQKVVSVKHIIEFKENLRVLLISSLFIILASGLNLEDIYGVITLKSIIFLLILVLIVRPASVFISSLRNGTALKEKLFLSWMAPRGIVAAAVSSVFALRLVEADYANAQVIVPMTFLVITGTVALYGLTAAPVAKLLGLASPNPQGILIVGAHSWARGIGKMLQDSGCEVLMLDSNWSNVSSSRQMGLRAYFGNVLSEEVMDEIEFSGVGRLMALTSNDEINSLSALHFLDIFGRAGVYQLPKQSKFKTTSEESIPKHLRGRLLFNTEATYSYLENRFDEGAVLKKTLLTDEFDYDSFLALYKDSAIPLFIVKEDRELVVISSDKNIKPQPGQQLIALVDELSEQA